MSASLHSTHPEECILWHPTKNNLTPDDVTASSHKRMWWQCLTHAHHVWQESVKDFVRPKKGGKCPFCDDRKVLVGENDLMTTHPDLGVQWSTHGNERTPMEVTARSSAQVTWVGDCGHEWTMQVSARALKNRGCPYCAGRLVLEGFNDLSATDPDLVVEWHPTKNVVSPQTISRGSTTKVWWLCSIDSAHEWTASPNSRTNNGTGCPVCAGRQVLIGVNDASTTHPDLLRQVDHNKSTHDLTQISQGSRTKMWWMCASGHSWQALTSDRVRGHGCPQCAHVISNPEIELREIIASWGFTVRHNARQVLDSQRELDIYLPDQKFAVEFNGLYWHSEKFKSQTYHQEKQRSCQNAGITLYQVWEDDWKARPEIVLRGIAHRLGVSHLLPMSMPEPVGARSTKIVVLSYGEASAFMNQNHIQGSAVGTYYLGLVDSQERLRAVLILKRTGKTGELSIERYATAGVVSGGFSKLLKHAEKTYKPSRWVTFADLSLSDGGLYEKTGFIAEKILKPDYSYLVNGKRVHKFNYRLKRFREDPNLLFEEGLTERELAVLNGLHRIWDSGKVRYVKNV